MQIEYEDRFYVINKSDSLKSLLTHQELLTLPMSVWKTIFEEKDGVCYFNMMLQVFQEEIKFYDKSSNVNGFYYNGKEYWLDKSTRVGLQNLVNSSSDNISLVLGNNIIELEVNKAKEFLSNLEVYAGKCYITTTKHLLATKEFKTIEDIINYDYTSGYPEKITLNE